MRTTVFRQRSAKHRFISLFFILVALIISACQPPPEPPLRIGTNVWMGYEPFYLARTLGYYQNSPIKLVELSSASDVIHALRSGNLEGATLTLDEALLLISEGHDLKVILVTDFSAGGDALVAKPEITSLEELKGKQVAVEYTAVGALLLDSALKAGGLELTDIDLVGCTVVAHLDCYLSNDAIVTFDPVRRKLMDMGANLLYDSNQIPDKIIDVLVVREIILDEHSKSLTHLVSGYFKARSFLDSNPGKAAQYMSKRMQLSPDKVLSTFEGIRMPSLAENSRLLKGTHSPLQLTAKSLSEFMFKRKLINKTIQLNGLSNDRFLPVNGQ